MNQTLRLSSFCGLVTLLSLALSFGVQAESQFPGYLSEKYCDDIKRDFMTGAVKSLQRYRDKQLVSRHRGGMNNIRNFLIQRQEWLAECDQYLSQTAKTRLFRDDSTTESIFGAMSSVNTELQSLINGVIYSMEGGGPTDVAAEKFDRLFKLVDDHQTRMLMRGQVVYR